MLRAREIAEELNQLDDPYAMIPQAHVEIQTLERDYGPEAWRLIELMNPHDPLLIRGLYKLLIRVGGGGFCL